MASSSSPGSRPPTAFAEGHPESAPKREFDALRAAIQGSKPILDVNLRWEWGLIENALNGHSATARTRFGLQSGPYHGFSGLVEGVNTWSPLSSQYFDGVDTPRGETIVADPERTAVNRVWLGYRNDELLGLDLKGGRQRIKLDDDRWIGNVGWRQNEQTFDALRVQTTLGFEGLLAQYIYAGEVNRIFGDQGPANRRDFEARGHFVNVAWTRGKALKAVAFAYLVDPNQNQFRGFGSQTYGARFTGAIPATDALSFPCQASYAYQQDFGNQPRLLRRALRVRRARRRGEGPRRHRLRIRAPGQRHGRGRRDAVLDRSQVQRVRRRVPEQWRHARPPGRLRVDRARDPR